jgi:hypothetical protein
MLLHTSAGLWFLRVPKQKRYKNLFYSISKNNNCYSKYTRTWVRGSVDIFGLCWSNIRRVYSASFEIRKYLALLHSIRVGLCTHEICNYFIMLT